MSWATWDLPEPPFMNDKFGITAGKKILNQLHYQLGVTGFSEVHVFPLISVYCYTVGNIPIYHIRICFVVISIHHYSLFHLTRVHVFVQ